ncbi:alpha-E domain-containing protein [Ornithinimicrobium sp. Arc0846-15]|nr:alpha-E domain-containing protein [Ornithinimicrobium laminariae]
MLSRIAESLFWIGRYLERAEDTSRLLDVHVQLLLEDPVVDEEAASRALLTVMGVQPEGQTDQASVMRLLGWDPDSQTSMVSAFWGARESARRSREIVSTEMWEAINTTWNIIQRGHLRRARPSQACQTMRERCAVISGIADSTMSHDQGWQFLVLGRSLERIDMTARMIEATAYTADAPQAWLTTLRACGAYHAFVRTYGGAESARDAAEFLLLDRLFPRSLVFSLNRAEAALVNLDVGERRAGFTGDAMRLIGRARAELEFRALSDVMSDLPARMTSLQRTCSEANDAVAQRYFVGANPVTWHSGVR